MNFNKAKMNQTITLTVRDKDGKIKQEKEVKIKNGKKTEFDKEVE